MDLFQLEVFVAVAREGSFSRAAEKLFRTQPAVSLAVQRLESDVGEKLLDRSQKELRVTEAGRTVLEHARRFDNVKRGLEDALAELRDKSAGRLIIGANESSILYLLPHLAGFRRQFPKIKVQVRRSQSRKIPAELLHGDLELGAVSYDPDDAELVSRVSAESVGGHQLLCDLRCQLRCETTLDVDARQLRVLARWILAELAPLLSEIGLLGVGLRTN